MSNPETWSGRFWGDRKRARQLAFDRARNAVALAADYLRLAKVNPTYSQWAQARRSLDDAQERIKQLVTK